MNREEYLEAFCFLAQRCQRFSADFLQGRNLHDTSTPALRKLLDKDLQAAWDNEAGFEIFQRYNIGNPSSRRHESQELPEIQDEIQHHPSWVDFLERIKLIGHSPESYERFASRGLPSPQSTLAELRHGADFANVLKDLKTAGLLSGEVVYYHRKEDPYGSVRRRGGSKAACYDGDHYGFIEQLGVIGRVAAELEAALGDSAPGYAR